MYVPTTQFSLIFCLVTVNNNNILILSQTSADLVSRDERGAFEAIDNKSQELADGEEIMAFHAKEKNRET